MAGNSRWIGTLAGCLGSGSDRREYPSYIEYIRKKEYPCLKKTTYLDHAGSTVPPTSLINRFSKDMSRRLYGNPHSNSPSSMLANTAVEDARLKALNFFHADPKHFDLIFVANATAAIKLVVDCFRDAQSAPDSPRGFRYCYHYDSHTSLVGAREHAQHGSKCFESDAAVYDWLMGEADYFGSMETVLTLFAYPGQSNMNGRRLPLGWSRILRRSKDCRLSETYTLLDAAALASTSQIDLSDPSSAPDFTAVSFYKIFGFPDLGALIVRKDSGGEVLKMRRYFGGGTVDMVTAVGDAWHAKRETSLHERLEDGTLPFHNIVALGHAIAVHQEIYGSMSKVSDYLASLSALLYEQLSRMQHYNGFPVCMIYKDTNSDYGNSSTQGPTIAFNVCNSKGLWVGKSTVENRAVERGIQLRTGGLCNPGGIARALQLSPEELRRNHAEGMRCGDDLDFLYGSPTGVVRVSLGAMSSKKDVTIFLKFVKDYFLETSAPMKEVVFSSCIHTIGSVIEHCTVESCKGRVFLENGIPMTMERTKVPSVEK
ncbi:MAG: hypothetical protein M1814_003891 [Vezdaea aestivalis]|nr:MAG: hypothetical protein M1814_003891 [Vezdaea aestivalis]